jgi:hypothetical protein
VRRTFSGAALLLVFGCYDPLPPSQVVWENPVSSLSGLREEVREAVTVDRATSFDGNGSLGIQTLGDSTFLLYALEGAALTGAKLENAQISYQARLRTDALEGEARIELGVRIAGGATYRAVPDMPALRGSTDWVMQEANFWSGPGERPDGIFLMLAVKGAGRVWIDRLKVLSTPRRPG